MAAILAGCNGISEKQARRRVDWIIASGTDEQRNKLEKAMDALQRTVPAQYMKADPETQRRILRLMGKMLAKKHRKMGIRPPCDDPVGRSKMLLIAQFLYSPKKIDRVFVPLVGHYIEELEEARGQGLLRVALVKIEWWYHFGKACGFDKWLAILELAGKIVKLVL